MGPLDLFHSPVGVFQSLIFVGLVVESRCIRIQYYFVADLVHSNGSYNLLGTKKVRIFIRIYYCERVQ